MALQIKIKTNNSEELVERINKAICSCDMSASVSVHDRGDTVYITISDSLGKGKDLQVSIRDTDVSFVGDRVTSTCPPEPLSEDEEAVSTQNNDAEEEGPFVTLENSLNDLAEKLRADVVLLEIGLSSKYYSNLLNRKQALEMRISALNVIGSSFQDLIEEVWDGVDKRLYTKELDRLEEEMKAVDKALKEYYTKIDTIKKAKGRLNELTKLVGEYISGEEEIELM